VFYSNVVFALVVVIANVIVVVIKYASTYTRGPRRPF